MILMRLKIGKENDAITKEGRLLPQQVAKIGYCIRSPFTPPEQSLESFLMAYNHKYRYFVVDIQKTKDGSLVCWHDLDLRRGKCCYSGGGKIEKKEVLAQYTLRELNAQFDFGIYKGKQYANTEVLLFEVFLDFLKKHPDAFAILEFKYDIASSDVELVTALLQKYAVNKQVGWAVESGALDTVSQIICFNSNATIFARRARKDQEKTILQSIFKIRDITPNVYLIVTDYYVFLETDIIEEAKKQGIKIMYSEVRFPMELFFFEAAGKAALCDLISCEKVYSPHSIRMPLLANRVLNLFDTIAHFIIYRKL